MQVNDAHTVKIKFFLIFKSFKNSDIMFVRQTYNDYHQITPQTNVEFKNLHTAHLVMPQY